MRTSFLALLLAASASAQSTVVLGNLQDGLDANNTDITSNVKLGVAFNTGNTSYLYLNSIEIGAFVGATSNYDVVLYTGNSVPNTASGFVASANLNLNNSDAGIYTFNFGGLELSKFTTYWLLPEQGLSWYTAGNFNVASELNASGYSLIANRRSNNSGVTWSDFPLPFSFQINASTAPIPEPSTYGLILGGLALAGAAIRRRKVAAK